MAPPKDPAGSGDKGAMRIDPKLVRELAELLAANQLTEIEVQDGERRIKVAREAHTVFGTAAVPAPSALGALPPALSGPPMHAKEGLGEQKQEELAGHSVKSPMVGTAYLSPQPGGKQFVDVGTR